MDAVAALLTGSARFTGDLDAPGLLHLAYVRSPHAHARITSIDTSAVTGATAFTAADLDVLPIWEIELIPERFAQPPLAVDVVRYVGERVVAVVAETLAAALDAAEQVVVGYEPLTPVVNPLASDVVALAWPSDAPGAAVEATRTVAFRQTLPRVAVAPMEGHAVLVVPDGDDLTVHVSTQVPNPTRVQLARALGLDPDRIRVVVPFVGGGFGGKAAGGHPDHVVAAAVARRLRRPVRYVEPRADNLVGMQGRGVHQDAELHADDDGRILALRTRIVADAGAYPNVAAVEPGKTRLLACGPYVVPVVDIDARSVVTNLGPTGAYRGPGRAEASGVLERSLDLLAADLGIDPVELRRRNLVRAFPHRTVTGTEYDSGDYAGLLDRLVEVSGYDELRRRQAAHPGLGIGIGVALVVDSTAWFSRTHGARVEVRPTGTVVVTTGTASAGHRHDVAYRTIVRRLLPVDDIEVVEGDTAAWGWGDGSMGSRSTQLAGTAIHQATEVVVAELRQRAARDLEAAVDDVVFHPGAGLGVRGVPARARTLAQLAVEPIGSSCTFEQAGATYPSAAHLSVVEVDLETGRVVPRRHVTVTDAGTVIDPDSARGQVVGATVQGIAQALHEEVVFDADGNPRTTSFAEYGIPSAAEVPFVEVHFACTPTDRNPLGAKGIGEIGMLAAPVAVQNAVADALRPFGVRHVDLPCTPRRVWEALARKSP